MLARTMGFFATAALGAILTTACGDAITAPIRVAPTTLRASGGSGSGGITGGGGGGGGGGGSQSVPQVAGHWTGLEVFDPSLSAFFPPGYAGTPQSITLNEDVSGNVTGSDDVMLQAITGKASSNGTIALNDGSYYGTRKMTMNVTSSVVCSDGSTGTAMSGKFQAKEGFGTITLDNCPVG